MFLPLKRPAPHEMLTCVDVPDVSCIRFHSIAPSSNHDPTKANANHLFPLEQFPFIFQLDDITTNFVTVISTSDNQQFAIKLIIITTQRTAVATTKTTAVTTTKTTASATTKQLQQQNSSSNNNKNSSNNKNKCSNNS